MKLDDFIQAHGGYWEGEVADYPLQDWYYEVQNGDTRASYWEWAYQQSMEECVDEN